MARAVFVKSARKDYPDHGIKKGESYYWWKFRFGGKHFSKEPPRRSQLTQSAFYGTLYDIEDRLTELTASENIGSDAEDIANELRDLAQECEDSRSNMPDSLQDSETGQMLEERAQALNDAADELERIASDCDIADKDDEQTADEFWQEKLDEIQAVSIDAP